jgi:putative lipoic acid-binding regulatory protein
LQKSTAWPSVYLYKFIVPSDPEKINQIQEIFKDVEAKIKTRASRNGKYTSLSIHVTMNSADEVIQKYRLVGDVEGVISL